MRTYYDSNGGRVGHSRSLKDEVFWNGTIAGLFLQFMLFVVAMPFYFFPQAVMRLRLTSRAKLLVIAGGWATLIGFGLILQNH